MKPCVYTTQHKVWLDAALACGSTELVCFRSARKWAKAAQLVDRHAPLPILFRQQDDSDHVLTCRFVAELAEIYFKDEFETEARRLAWLEDKLWLQRITIQKDWRTDRFPTWQAQFQAWEIDNFMKSKTWYIVRGLQEIEPLSLPHLRKLKHDDPLSPNFIRGYALCHYPADEIRRVVRPATAV
ncbi:MAG: hypothetical protein ACR2IB_03505 [Pyrinomonadaceae bacterium]